MDSKFWHQRWADDQIGFHQPAGNPLLARCWSGLAVPVDARVLVPLCGKTPDMVWLAGRGHSVLGVELSERAVADFFREQGLTPARTPDGALTRFAAEDITLLAGDFFDVPAAEIAGCEAFYDRAALIALPPAMRERYVRHLAEPLPAGARGLLIAVDYSAHEMEGPPFPVPESAVRELLSPWFEISLLTARDALADSEHLRERGLSALTESAYALQRH